MKVATVVRIDPVRVELTVLEQEPQIDVDRARRRRGDRAALMRGAASAAATSPSVAGIAFRRDGRVIDTPPAPMIADLDAYRVGWELIDHAATAIGAASAPSSCSSRAAARTCATTAASAASGRAGATAIPMKFAQEIAWLHREHGVELFNLADENPTVRTQALARLSRGADRRERPRD